MSIDYGILRSPHLTEKGALASEKSKSQVLVFRVRKDATKHQIREAVEKIFSVKVAKIQTAVVGGKLKRQGRFAGHRPDWKKAVVTLKPGQKPIEFFEGA